MIQDSTLIEVQNLTDSRVVYISYDGKRRAFAGQQKMKIPAEELRQLYYSRGGVKLLTEYLSVKNQELAREFNVSDDSFEHEYNWSRADVDNLLMHGSDDALKDALDFAPDGIRDLIIERAVELRIANINRRKLITEFTGKDINSMITQLEAVEEASPQEETRPTASRRRVSGEKQEEKATTGRRTQE